jgi:hypothetical protein
MDTALVMAGCRRPLPFMPTRFLYLLRPPARPEKGAIGPASQPKDKTSASARNVIVCRQCLHVITASAQRIVVNGAHAHSFANPQGIIFEIACYRDAWGCSTIGRSSPEFTWFAGYVWRIAVCANCLVHLGWRFSAPDGHFFHGLITSRLIGDGG